MVAFTTKERHLLSVVLMSKGIPATEYKYSAHHNLRNPHPAFLIVLHLLLESTKQALLITKEQLSSGLVKQI